MATKAGAASYRVGVDHFERTPPDDDGVLALRFNPPQAVRGHWRMVYIIAWNNGRPLGSATVVPDRASDHWCGNVVRCQRAAGSVYIHSVG